MDETLTAEQIGEIEKMLAKATPGEWEVQDSCSWRRIGVPGGQDGGVICPTKQRDGHPDLLARRYDLDLVCLLKNAAPALIAMAKRAQKSDEWRETAATWLVRAEEAEIEAKSLRIQVDAMAQIGGSRERQFAKAVEERGKLRSHNWTLAESLTNASRAVETMAQERDVLREEVAFWRGDLAARLCFAVGLHRHAIKKGDAARASNIAVNNIMPWLASLDSANAKEWHGRCDFCGEFIRPEDEQQSHGDGGSVHRRCGSADAPGHVEGSAWQEKAIADARAIAEGRS